MYNPIRSSAFYRDFWGDVNAFITERLDPILQAGCYVPRWYHAPSNDLELLPGPNGYLRYVVQIPAGSWIIGFRHNPTTASGSPPTFWMNLTDLGLNHKMFGNQWPETYFGGEGVDEGIDSPWLLDYPYPVVAPGLFLTEFWNPNATTNRVSITLAVAEISPDVMSQVNKGAK